MCPGLRGESGTGQETNRSSPGCADTGPLCNLGAASRPSADTAKLLAGTRFCLFFPSARRQAEENLGGPCGWAESAGQQQALRSPRRGLACPSTPDGQAGSQQRPRGDYHRVWKGEETQAPRSPIVLPLAPPTPRKELPGSTSRPATPGWGCPLSSPGSRRALALLTVARAGIFGALSQSC